MHILTGFYNYGIAIILMMIGFYLIITHGNLIKKIIGLNIFQGSVFILFISMGYSKDGTAPIYSEAFSQYSAPLPHVLILTAIVVGIATTALGLALTIRIYRSYGSIEEDTISRMDNDN